MSVVAVQQKKQEKRKIMVVVDGRAPEFVQGTHWNIDPAIESLVVWDDVDRVAEFHRMHWTTVKFADS